MNSVSDIQVTPLYLAVQNDKLPVVDLLLLRGADPSIGAIHTKTIGRTALHQASIQGSLDVAKRLLQGGAKVNQLDSLNSSPLHMAALYGQLKVVKLLVVHGADIDQVTRYRPGDQRWHHPASNGCHQPIARDRGLPDKERCCAGGNRHNFKGLQSSEHCHGGKRVHATCICATRNLDKRSRNGLGSSHHSLAH